MTKQTVVFRALLEGSTYVNVLVTDLDGFLSSEPDTVVVATSTNDEENAFTCRRRDLSGFRVLMVDNTFV